MYCHKCGTQLPSEALFCFRCGVKQNQTVGESNSIVSSRMGKIRVLLRWECKGEEYQEGILRKRTSIRVASEHPCELILELTDITNNKITETTIAAGVIIQSRTHFKNPYGDYYEDHTSIGWGFGQILIDSIVKLHSEGWNVLEISKEIQSEQKDYFEYKFLKFRDSDVGQSGIQLITEKLIEGK